MTRPTSRVDRIPSEELEAYVTRQRWYAARHQPLASATVMNAVTVAVDPVVAVALVGMHHTGGTHDVYQLVVGEREPQDGPAAIAMVEGVEVYDLAADPTRLVSLVEAIRSSATFEDGDQVVVFRSAVGSEAFDPLPTAARPAGVEQSNSSVILDERMILKSYRRLEPGLQPELEILRVLAEVDFPHTPPLLGWYQHQGGAMTTALGMLQTFRDGAVDGWEHVLVALRDGRGEEILPAIAVLGEVTGALHVALGSRHDDPAFAPEDVSQDAIALLSASLDEEITEVFASLPEDDPKLDAFRHQAEDVRRLAGGIMQATGLGRRIRGHGDLHLGQALWLGDRWELIDFEGEPARSVSERRRKHSPLRDVAGMLRSIDYADGAIRLLEGHDIPDGWRERARNAFWEGYAAVVESSGLLPPTDQVRRDLLRLYELEKAVYEMRYEVAHRREWLQIPIDAIQRMIGPS